VQLNHQTPPLDSEPDSERFDNPVRHAKPQRQYARLDHWPRSCYDFFLAALRNVLRLIEGARLRSCVRPVDGSASSSLGFFEAFFFFAAKGVTTLLIYWGRDQSAALSRFNNTGSSNQPCQAGSTTTYVWDVEGALQLLLQDGSTAYIYGPGGLPLEPRRRPTHVVLTAV
jgi:hypothetical protein